jgi:uncharacterized protein (TIGR02996 family)
MLDGERIWLSAVVDNLADDNTKLVYADWLTEHGDPDRAAFLRAFVAAARTMDFNTFPAPDPAFGEEWLDLIGFGLLRGLAAEGLPELTRPVLELARPALRMVEASAPDADIPVGASKVGGLPDLPPGYSWPTGNECRAIYNDDTAGVEELARFVAQVNFAEVAQSQATRTLPRVGLLSFFAFQDIENDNPDVVGVGAVFFRDPTGLVRTDPPAALTEGNTVMPAARLTFEETLDLPDAGPYGKGPWGSVFSHGDKQSVGVVEEYRAKNFKNMLGYGRSTTGGDKTPDKMHRHLIVLSNGCRLHIQIHQADLAELAFDKIKLVWVDFD